MHISQSQWSEKNGWKHLAPTDPTPQIVLVFGARTLLTDPTRFAEIKNLYPKSHILLASTAGEILGNKVSDDTIAVTTISFEKTDVKFAQQTCSGINESYESGKIIAGKLDHKGLVHVMAFSEGLKINGTALVKGILEILPPTVSVTGGLVGDGELFKETVVGLDELPTSGNIVLVGFYGEHLRIGYASLGGWDNFGPDRLITKSKGNVLYELDGRNALDLYKEYLGDKAKELPASGLFFPMSLQVIDDSGKEKEVVRTLLGIEEATNGMIFAGDMPEGTYAKLMKVNFDRLIDGATTAANNSVEQFGTKKPEFAILISCIGRKLVLGDRIEEEIDGVLSIIGKDTPITGFYSYGEISPTVPTERQCQLHNQTMTITVFREE
ncbi:MAG: FIST C-terminal domain-containing protein [bacterium]|nr:FIST C-terminal domain-containing protein [bacterium]